MEHTIKEANPPPDIFAITELKLKNYTRELNTLDYNLDGYVFEVINLDHKGSAGGVGIQSE